MKTPNCIMSGARLLRLAGVLALPLASLATAQISEIHHQGWINVVSATGNGWMQFPRAISFGIDNSGTTVKKVLLNWQTNSDSIQFPMTHGYAGSANAGATWASPSPITTTSPDLDMMTSIRRNDGTVLAVPFYPSPSVSGVTSFSFSYQTSTNNGVSWTIHTNGLVDFGTNALSSFRFHRGIIGDSDGTLYAPAYVVYTGTPTQRAVLTRSTDGGTTWKWWSIIKYDTTKQVTETTVLRCKNGDFLAVFRSSLVSTGVTQSLQYARSTNKGFNWTASANLSGVPANQGVDPYLYLMPNGIAVLTYGEDQGAAGRDIHLAFSADGNGTSWSNDTITFTGVSNVLESTGYTSVVPITAHRFMQLGDTGGNQYYSSQHPTPNPFKIRSKIVDVVLAQRNRIDLAGKLAAGTLTVTTDMTYTNAANPEARTTGAFDGGVDYWSGAFKSATSGSYTLDLQQTYTLTSLGVCLQQNTSESATIDYSTNGSSWTTIKTYTNAVHNAIDYTSLASIQARYIRVTATSAASPVGLNEIELYSRADTFENWADGIALAAYTGYTTPNGGFWVSGDNDTQEGYQSQRALFLSDGDTLDKTAKKTFTAVTTKTLEFVLKPAAYASGGAIQWRFTSGTTNAIRLRTFDSGGQIQYYNGSAYVNVSGAFAPINTWTKIKLVADAGTDTATLFVNGVQIGATGSIGHETAVASFDGFLFSSGGAAASGDQAFFDDVDVY